MSTPGIDASRFVSTSSVQPQDERVTPALHAEEASGAAVPGARFEATDEFVHTGKALSPPALQKVVREGAAHAERRDLRHQLQTRLTSLECVRDRALGQIEDEAAALRPAVASSATFEESVEAARSAVTGSFETASSRAAYWLQQPELTANDIAAFTHSVEGLQQTMLEAAQVHLAPFQLFRQVRQEGQQVLRRVELARDTAIIRTRAIGYQLNSIPSNKYADHIQQVRGMLEEAGCVRAQLFDELIGDIRRLLGQRIQTPDEARQLQQAIVSEGQRLKPIISRLNELLDRVTTEIDSIRETLASENRPRGLMTLETLVEDGVRHWDVSFENEGHVPFVGTITFARSVKNSGEGFEAMAVPGSGWKATQRISSNRDHGLKPQPGEMLRVQVRGFSFMELPLPEDGTLRIPVDDFQPMQRENRSYAEASYVQSKVSEKSGLKFSDNTAKVQFFRDGERVYR